MRLPLLVALIVGISLPAHGRDIFVNNLGGDDINDGWAATSVDGGGPLRTLAKALDVVERGDRIIIANTGKPYQESISLDSARHCGSPGRPLVIVGNGATLNGSVAVPVEGWEHYQGDIFRFRPHRLTYQQLFIDGLPVNRIDLTPGGATLLDLKTREWCLEGGFIYFRVEPRRTVYDYDFSYAGRTVGITLYGVHDVVISDLTVQGFQLDGINAHDGVRKCRLQRITCRGNGRSGIALGGTSRVDISQCLLGDNGFCQLLAEGFSVATVEESELLPGSGPAVVERGGEVTGLSEPATAE